MPPTNRQLFERVIMTLFKRPDPFQWLTLNQIASVSLRSGTPQNSAVIGRMVSEFSTYFRSEGRKICVEWSSVRRDYPQLFQESSHRSESFGRDALAGMVRALEDEVRAVRQDMEEHPIGAFGTTEIGAAGEGSYLYEALIDLPGDAELPIPEGVGIKLVWPRFLDPGVVDATLLGYDAVSTRIVFEVEQPLSRQHVTTDFRILPRVDELLVAIKAKLMSLEGRPGSLAWRFLHGNLAPKPVSWSQPILTDGIDDAQQQAIRRCLTQDVTFVWGPPGTGKTHTLGKLIASAVLGGQRVLGVSISNVAVDQLALSLVRALDGVGEGGRQLLASGAVLRFGHPRVPDVVREARLFPDKLETQALRAELVQLLQRLRDMPPRDLHARALAQKGIKEIRDKLRTVTRDVIQRARVVLTTAVQVCLEPIIGDGEFGSVVIDEASMMPIPHLACMALMAQRSVVVAGDFRQLGPIAVSKSEAAYQWLHKDAFELAGLTRNLTHPALVMLNLQRRMHPDICELINRTFYGGRLRTDSSSLRTGATALAPLPGKSALLVEFGPGHGSQVEQTDSGSRVNRRSAEVTMRLVDRLVRTDPSLDIRIVTPYRAQVALIKRLLQQAQLPRELMNHIQVGTVHAFQGSEADVIVWDVVDTVNHPIGRLYRGDTGNRLANVAITRARGKLLIVGDPLTFSNAPQADAVEGLKGIFTRFRLRSGNVVTARGLGLV